MTAKYKAGDRVKITSAGHQSAFLLAWEGLAGTVKSVDDPNALPFTYLVSVDGRGVRAFNADELEPNEDVVNHPPHYTQLGDGVEVIDITSKFSFVVGNVLKYVLRAEFKGSTLEDYRKARWYLNREIAELEKQGAE